ncbi:alpha-D-xyloside xylohydrolase [Arcticibacter pallidicorallinus]|uniref:Alpha-D-xyloside xylohydrolase n=1 Tax=Arcticibacter pallidicorallinus TaxID=1259464 RepID=A0A2T0U8S2_9SPHI|nr:TIM-barrel domain-containing protein [Arcticibacter pallidicorallinus]PRY54258.1 alpha-D-xyloside xylohydrolase [Arcticibacter pallidicorallinus]
MHKNILVAILFCSLFSVFVSAQDTDVKKLSDGVIITLNDKAAALGQTITLKVLSDKIIRVTSAALGAPTLHKSLMVSDNLLSAGTPTWDMTRDAEKITLKTSSMQAVVKLTDGMISFTDAAGKPIVSEQRRDAGTFIADSHSGDSFYKIRQGFEVGETEGFYGLGQHQNGVMNYRGHQVELLQYNTDVAIPFVISTNNYGILWDNYSITKVGDVRTFRPLSGLKLYSKSGEVGWLTATYSDLKDSRNTISRAESDIDYSFLKDLKNFPDSFKLVNGKVRWEGDIESPYSGLHTFLFKYAGYIKIWVDGKLQADRWRQPWNAGAIELQVLLEDKRKYSLVIEWLPDGGESYLSFKWQSPIPQNEKNDFSFLSEAGDQVDYYLVSGKDLDEVIAGYRLLTGKASIVPKWAMGFWQSRERYKTQDEILSTVKTFRDRKIPLDNIVLDWSYWEENQWGSQEFDTERFPSAEQMISDLHDKYNTRLMISVWPKFYEGTDAYNSFAKKGWLYRRNVEDGRKDWIAKGYKSTFYDPFNPEARVGFWNLLNDKLYKKGIDAWWLDATEPDIHSNLSVETRKSIFTPSLGSGARYFNAFPLLNAKGIYEGQRKENPNDRVFILTRSAYGGLQRYATVTWSGDISSRWHDMRDQISAGVNFSMSGLPYWAMDIGGFSVERRFENAKGDDLKEWREMNTRWYQFGAFTPVFRVHGQFPFREIYNIAPEGHPAYSSMLYYNKLRYRLMPYIYSLAGQAYHQHYTIMRGLVMDFPHDDAVRNIDNQFMFGPSLLINPVSEYEARSRKVYLPKGIGWYDLYTGTYFKGGQNINAEAPYERMPLFVKEGSILTFGPELQYTSEKPADPIRLYVYTGRDASFNLYEDEGTNYNYERNAFSNIPISYNEKDKTLTIGQREGSFEGMLRNRTFEIFVVTPRAKRSLSFDSPAKQKLRYSGQKLSVKI